MPAVTLNVSGSAVTIATVATGGGIGPSVGTNVGTGAGIYKDNLGSLLRLRSLKAGSGVTVAPSADEIELSADEVDFSTVQAALATAISAVGFNSQAITDIADPTNAQDAATKSYVDDFVAANIDANLSPLNRDMIALVTGGDNSLACATALLSTPPVNAWILVLVNGLSYKVGNGTKAGMPSYFSGDGGLTARATGALVTGDMFYWNGSVAGFQLDAGDRIDFVFEAL